MTHIFLKVTHIVCAKNIRQVIVARDTKGSKWRRTILPDSMVNNLQQQIAFALSIHKKYYRIGYGEVYLPNALAKKYQRAAKEPSWHYVFPANHLAIGPRSGIERYNQLDLFTGF